MRNCTCYNGCKFCRNSDCYSAPMKFKVGQRVKRTDSLSNKKGVISELHQWDNTYRVMWDEGHCSWVHQTRLNLDEPTDYRALIEAEVDELLKQVKELENRADTLRTALKTLDELDKKA